MPLSEVEIEHTPINVTIAGPQARIAAPLTLRVL
uniref:Uncharacterized protein n=1 Tax=Ralstonia solanacearum TaxID=305 RepID=A0A0S4TS59_RALSL|nr:protein of unknown function [Ralstonia solanacearum]